MSAVIAAMKTGDLVATTFADIPAAVTYIGSGKGTVYIGPGVLSMAAGVTVSSATDITFQGSGKGVTVLQGTASLICFSVATKFKVIGLTFDTWDTAVDFSSITSVVDQISVEDCEIKNYKRGIYAVNLTPAIGVSRVYISNNHITTGSSYAIFINVALMDRVHILGNNIKDCVQRAVDLGGNSLVFADDRGMYVVDGNLIDGVTAVGTSAIAVILYGWRGVVTNNTIRNVRRDSPTASDCDGIYTKCRYSIIANNTLVDAGQNEGFINIKGGARNESVSQPYGFSVLCVNNMLVDTQTTPTLGGGSYQTSGIKIATSEVLVANNQVQGLTDVAIYSDSDSGSDAPCHNIVLSGNIIKDHRGYLGIGMFGRGSRIRVVNNLIDSILGSFDTSKQNFGIKIAKKEGSGVDVVGNRVYNVVDTGHTPVAISFNPSASSFVVTADASTDTLTTPSAHTLAVNDTVKFTTTGTLPAPLVAGTLYYVKTVPTGLTLTLSATLGGATIDLTTNGTPTNTLFKMATITGTRLGDNHLEGARYGIQTTWDSTYMAVDDMFMVFNTGRNINGTSPPLLADLEKFSDTPTHLTYIPYTVAAGVLGLSRISNVLVELGKDPALGGAAIQEFRVIGDVSGADREWMSFRADSSHGTIEAGRDAAGTYNPIELWVSGAAAWKWSASGHYQPAVSNTVDIGSASLRTRDIYVGGDVLANNAASRVYLDYTNTGTIGNVTINKVSGRVNLASAGSPTTLVVTNNRVTAASHVNAWPSQADTTGRVLSVVPAAGSFTINCVAATANMAIDFVVFNAD